MRLAVPEPAPRRLPGKFEQDRPVADRASLWCGDVSAQRRVQGHDVPSARDFRFTGGGIKLRRGLVVGDVTAPAYAALHNQNGDAA